MSDLNRRLRKLEGKLNVDKEPRVAEIVWFANAPLPPDHTEGNITIRYVRFDDICKKKAEQ